MPSPFLPSAITDHPSFRSFAVQETPLICIPDSVPLDLVRRWKDDALALRMCGFGQSAGVVKDHLGRDDLTRGILTTRAREEEQQQQRRTTIRKNVHQIWVQSPGLDRRPLQAFVGDTSARQKLCQWTDALRCVLSHDGDDGGGAPPRSLPADCVELSYLLYDVGAYYAKHVDVKKRDVKKREIGGAGDGGGGDGGGHRRRVVSFLLYLGGTGDDDIDIKHDRPWNCETDGGALRIHGDPYAACTGSPVQRIGPQSYADVTPASGTLVLFDSLFVSHEVLPVMRRRACVVGWFGGSDRRDYDRP